MKYELIVKLECVATMYECRMQFAIPTNMPNYINDIPPKIYNCPISNTTSG